MTRRDLPRISLLASASIQAVLRPTGELTALHRSGDARISAVTAPARLECVPDVTIFTEAGLAERTCEEPFGAMLPARAPEALVADLHRGIAAPAQNAQPRGSEFSAFRGRMLREHDAWGPVVTAPGFNPGA